YLKSNRAETIKLLGAKFGHSPSFAGKTFDDYLVCLDERLTVDFKQLEKLLSQVAPDTPGGAKQLASEWIVPGALRECTARVVPTNTETSFLLYRGERGSKFNVQGFKGASETRMTR